jgi:cobalamin biosynthesis Mg chelatase CobN
LSAQCWPDRLIGALPNIYLYAANNPSEGALAKRRGAATLVSYLTPSLTHSGLYKELVSLQQSIERWQQMGPDQAQDRESLTSLIRELSLYDPLLPTRPAIVVANKMDLRGGAVGAAKLRAATQLPVLPVSALSRDGVGSVVEALRFLLDGQLHEVPLTVAPTRTVLNYLREDLGRCGSNWR